MALHFAVNISHLFPRLAVWSNFGALGSMAAFAAGICIAHMTPLQLLLLHEQLYPVFLPAAIVCCATGIFTGKRRVRFLAFGMAGVMGCFVQSVREKHADTCIAELSAAPLRISGDIISPPEPRRDGFVFLLSLDQLDGTRHPFLSGKIFLCKSQQNPPIAGTLVLDGFVRPCAARENRYDFDERSFLTANGIAGKIDVNMIHERKPPCTLGGRLAVKFRSRLMSVLKQYKSPCHRALIRASFTGEKAYIDPEIKAVFRRSGLYHLLALSGFHAAVLLTALYSLLAPFPLPTWIKHGIAVLALWTYLEFIGPIPSLTRAVIMASVVIASMMFQRKNYPLQALGIAGLLWLSLSPLSLFQPDFQLSYGATFGILTLQPLLARLYRGLPHPAADFFLRSLFLSLSVSMSAFLMTLPILLHFFGSVPIYGIFANIAAVPLMSGTMWTFFTALLADSLSSWVSRAAIALSEKMIDWLLIIASFGDRVPFSLTRGHAPYPEIIAAFYIFLLAAVTIDRRRIGTLLALGFPLLLCTIAADYLIRRMSTGPAVIRFAASRDAAVTAVRWPRGNTWLFCSGKEPAMRSALRYSVAGWMHHTPGTTIDRLIIAHSDGTVIDSGKGGLQRMRNVDSFRIVNGARRCTCSFISDRRRSALVVSCSGARVVSNHAGLSAMIGNAADTFRQTIHPPAAAVLKRNRFRIFRFD